MKVTLLNRLVNNKVLGIWQDMLVMYLASWHNYDTNSTKYQWKSSSNQYCYLNHSGTTSQFTDYQPSSYFTEKTVAASQIRWFTVCLELHRLTLCILYIKSKYWKWKMFSGELKWIIICVIQSHKQMKMINKKISVTIVGWYLSNILIYNGIWIFLSMTSAFMLIYKRSDHFCYEKAWP